ncbi:hypothetical protein L596_019193 [Steinernema carpocapsae]|uniref:Uncharacterized protein n=1 Tax=Steinernema carpocapsae TaxID=34508 RepID=A0A4V6A0H1_STECR|nr:hypothetical protein L596_019193 [Steinernema carpocapsae]
MGYNNISITVLLAFLYSAMLLKIYLTTRQSGGQVQIQKSIFYQAGFICLLNAFPALIYLYMQFFSAPEWLIAAGHFAWQGSNGGPAFVYVLCNKTIQKHVLTMFGFGKRRIKNTVSNIGPMSEIPPTSC